MTRTNDSTTRDKGVALNHKELQKLLRDEFSMLIMKSLSMFYSNTLMLKLVLTVIGRRCRILTPRPTNVLQGF
jgi:hypothetical protein